jgi:peptidoglycan/xylan/chitin deacetylase (PgdA/CDA1 family)
MEWTRRGISYVARSAAFSGFLGLLERADDCRPNLLRVLTYHRVDEPDARPGLDPGLISATPRRFEQQMSYVAANYRVLSMRELLDARQTGTTLPPRAVLLTFDDAYRDFADQAWPILKRYGLPATLFVPTAFPGQPERTFWWDHLCQAVQGTAHREGIGTPLGQLPLATPDDRRRALHRLKKQVKSLPHGTAMALVEQICSELGSASPEHHVLDWDALRHLAREGVTLGAHTRTHPLMNRISPEEARAEAVGSLRDLERRVPAEGGWGSVLPVFAYPAGGCNGMVAHLLAREGFAAGFTTIRGVNCLASADPLRLRRINVGQRTTLSVLRAQLLSRSVYLNRAWSLCGS